MKKYLVLIVSAVSVLSLSAQKPAVSTWGGLLEPLVPSVTVDDGWGGKIALDTRAWTISISVVPNLIGGINPSPSPDPIVASITAQNGKLVDADTFKAGGPLMSTTLTRTEVKALPSITLASLIAAAKAKLGLK